MSSCTTAQVSTIGTKNPKANGVADAQGIREEPEILPEYPGGLGAYARFLKHNIEYPPAALRDGVQGITVIRFVLDSTGAVQEPRIQQSLRADCDAEALRVIGQMPRWKPGREKGRAVATWVNAPVGFEIR